MLQPVQACSTFDPRQHKGTSLSDSGWLNLENDFPLTFSKAGTCCLKSRTGYSPRQPSITIHSPTACVTRTCRRGCPSGCDRCGEDYRCTRPCGLYCDCHFWSVRIAVQSVCSVRNFFRVIAYRGVRRQNLGVESALAQCARLPTFMCIVVSC